MILLKQEREKKGLSQTELARLSGGDRLTETLLAGAEEMLRNAEEFRASAGNRRYT